MKYLAVVWLLGLALLSAGRAAGQGVLEALERELIALSRRVQRAVVSVEGGVLAAPGSVPPGGLWASPNNEAARRWMEAFRLFNLPSPVTRKGSGCVIGVDGWVLTSADIVRGTETCIVRLADGRRETARVVSIDEVTNLALLKVNTPLPVALPLGDSDRIEQGSLLLCMGTLGGYEQSLVLCVAAGKERAAVIGEQQFLSNLLQVSGSVGAGSSGAPVMNTRGELVGIIVAGVASGTPLPRIARDTSATGTLPETFMLWTGGGALAVPINDVKAVLAEMQAGRLRRPYLGIMPADRDGAEGAEVVRVTPGSPAARAGLRLGDVILSMNGSPIRRAADVSSILRRAKPGDRMVIEVVRDAQRVRLNVTLEERPRRNPS